MSIFARYPQWPEVTERDIVKEIFSLLSKEGSARTDKDVVVVDALIAFFRVVETRLLTDIGRETLCNLYLKHANERESYRFPSTDIRGQWLNVAAQFGCSNGKKIDAKYASRYFDATRDLQGRWHPLKWTMRSFYGTKRAQRVFEALWDEFFLLGLKASLPASRNAAS